MTTSGQTTGRIYKLGWLAMASLLILRFAVGWHFFKEGVAKLRNPAFSSRAFLQDARGPWAHYYWSLVDDPLELNRLDEHQVVDTWDQYLTAIRARATTDEMRQALDEAGRRWKSRLSDLFREWGADLPEYRAKAEPLTVAMRNVTERSQPHVDRQTRTRIGEMQKMRAPWLAELQRLEQLMQDDVAQIVGMRTPSNAAEQVGKPTRSRVDHAVIITTLSVGVLLLIGLLVPLASLVGCAFLLSVMATQPFWAEGANLTYSYYQAVEIAALLVLATTGAGRFAGLDFFWSAVKR